VSQSPDNGKAASPWQLIDALLDGALDQPTDDRVAWVRANAPDTSFADEVVALLASADRHGVLDQALPTALLAPEPVTEIIARLSAALEGRYRIDAVLGQGGAATVFLAHEQKHDRFVVLKVLRPEIARWIGAERFLAEIQILARMSHPHILALIDSGNADGLLYYVMPYVGGETLRDRLAKGPLSSDDALPLLRDIAAALAYAHEQRLVHRDLKPDNILIVSGHAFLMDFGIAKLSPELHATGETAEGFVVGTPAYMAPEQAAGMTVDVRADLYSWGIVAAEAVAGRKRSNGLPRHVPRQLRAVIRQCLAHDPAQRPVDGRDLLVRIDAVGDRDVPKVRRSKWIVGGVAASLVAGLGFFKANGGPTPLARVAGTVVVAPLTNETGDTALALLGRMAGDWLTQGLHQTGRVAVVPWPVALQASIAAASHAGGDPVRSLAAEADAQTLVTGAYYLNGNTVRFQAQVTDALHGTVLAALQPIEVPRDSVRAGIQQLRDRLMAVFAIRTDQRLSDVPGLIDQPPTYEAYRSFERGIDRFNALDYRAATDAFLDAWRTDTSFVIPLVYAATAYLNRSDYTRADSLVAVLRRRADRLNPYHELTLRYTEARLAGDAKAALEMARQAAAEAPGGRAQYNAATIALSMGQVDDALATLHGLDPDRGLLRGWAPYWFVLTHAQHLKGDFAAELKTTEEMRRRYPASRAGWVHEARALAVAGDVRGADSLIAAASALPPDTYWSQGAMLVIIGEELDAHGHPGAQRYYDAAVTWLANQLARDPANSAHRYWMGSVQLDRGSADDAAPYFESLAHDFPDDVQFRGLWGVSAAIAGDTALARQRLGTAPAYRQGEYLSYLARYAGIAGDTERAIALWSEAEIRGLSGIVWLHASARRDLASVAHDSRFRRLGILPEERNPAK
jgi:tRNA A-37 threonylcarbamoyl transferase component Bud32